MIGGGVGWVKSGVGGRVSNRQLIEPIGNGQWGMIGAGVNNFGGEGWGSQQ